MKRMQRKMRVTSRSWFVTMLGCALAACVITGAHGDPSEHVTTDADRSSLNVTVYNGGSALIHDRRRVALVAGAQRLAWRDVAAQMQPESALLEEPAHPGDLGILEQNFDYDVLSPGTVLAKYVGRDITIVHEHARPGRPRREQARLLANSDGVVLQYRDRVETSIDGTIEYPTLPADLRDRPTLVLNVTSQAAATAELDLAYLTGGIGWHADYVGIVTADETRLELGGLVTLTNTSGATYRDARLQLVAGNVNLPPVQMQSPGGSLNQAYAAIARVPREESYFEYHLYTLPLPTTIEQNQTKQVALLSAHRVPLVKTLELRGEPSYYQGANPDLGDKLKIGTYLTFANRGGDLGIPLPGGTVRLYKNDSGGTSQFLGSDTIDHTPKNEDVRLHVGDSFDVTARKKQTDFKAHWPYYDSSYEIVVGNAKTQAQDVLVVEPIPCGWTITAESARHTKSSSSTANWLLHVPAGGHTTLTYSTQLHCI